MELSGKQWVAKFPTSRSLADLDPSFKSRAEEFVAALKAANAVVKISATFRPKERAYLMHYSFRISRESLDPNLVPKLSTVPIEWVHKKANGSIDLNASVNAAEDMVDAYEIIKKPVLKSRHTLGTAVDMTISWTGTLSIKGADGKVVQISSTPRSGQNRDLHNVALTYGVKKLISDPPHWSLDGH